MNNIITNFDFCKFNNMSIDEIDSFRKSLGIESFDEFVRAECKFKPKFGIGDVIYPTTGPNSYGEYEDLNYVVIHYNPSTFMYILIPTSCLCEFRPQFGNECTYATKDAEYHLARKIDNSYQLFGHIDEDVVKKVEIRSKY